MDPEYEELLDLIPAFRRGELSPGKAHQVAKALRENAEFTREATREEVVISALTGMRAVSPPRGLVARAVRLTTGMAKPEKWFSFDTLLFALGIGVVCAAVAQLLAKWVQPPEISSWMIAIADYAATKPLDLIAVVFAVILVLMGAGTWLTLKALRS